MSHVILTQRGKWIDQYPRQEFKDKYLCHLLLPLQLTAVPSIPNTFLQLNYLFGNWYSARKHGHGSTLICLGVISSPYTSMSYCPKSPFSVLSFVSSHCNPTIWSELQSFPFAYSITTMSSFLLQVYICRSTQTLTLTSRPL